MSLFFVSKRWPHFSSTLPLISTAISNPFYKSVEQKNGLKFRNAPQILLIYFMSKGNKRQFPVKIRSNGTWCTLLSKIHVKVPGIFITLFMLCWKDKRPEYVLESFHMWGRLYVARCRVSEAVGRGRREGGRRLSAKTNGVLCVGGWCRAQQSITEANKPAPALQPKTGAAWKSGTQFPGHVLASHCPRITSNGWKNGPQVGGFGALWIPACLFLWRKMQVIIY